MTYVIRIDTDGSVTELEGTDLLGPANREFDRDVGVITLRPPIAHPGIFVGAIHDSGVLISLPLNVKAWALYGASPIVGPMFLALDQDDDGNRQELPDSLIQLIKSDDFPSLKARTAMQHWLDEQAQS